MTELVLTDLHKRLLNDFQRDFPLSERPYQAIAEQLGVSESTVLTALTELSQQQLISRVGPIIRPNHIGVSTLAAIAVPQAELETVANAISRYPEINHNYEREHELNLWFVVIADNNEQLAAVIASIEAETGYPVLQFPLLQDFYIDLGFELNWQYI